MFAKKFLPLLSLGFCLTGTAYAEYQHTHTSTHAKAPSTNNISSYQKPGANIQLMDASVRTMAEYSSQSFELELYSLATSGTATIELSNPTGGLTLSQTTWQQPLSGHSLTLHFDAQSQIASREHLALQIALEQDGRIQYRHLGVVVQVGNSNAALRLKTAGANKNALQVQRLKPSSTATATKRSVVVLPSLESLK